MPDYEFHTYAPDAMAFNPGTGNFDFSSSYDFRTDRNFVDYSDDDSQLDGDEDGNGIGDDANQVGTAFDDQGNVIASGTVYTPMYAIIRPVGGGPEIYLDRIEVDGVHVGYISDAQLVPGTSYEIVETGQTGANSVPGGGSNTVGHSYYEANSVPCFAAGTLVETGQGLLPVEQVQVGMGLRVTDGSCRTVMWRHVSDWDLRDGNDDARPIQIKPGALGPGCPARDLVISAQHRVLVGHPSQSAGLSGPPRLVPARALTGLPGIRVMSGKRKITWVHLACRNHHVINVQGCLTETLLLGTSCLRGLPAIQRLDLCALFAAGPRMQTPLNGPAAFPCLTVQQGRRLLARKKNKQAA